MALARTRTIALRGAVGHLIDVQVDVAQGMVATAIVGRADAALQETRDRCRSAVGNSGWAWPSTRRTTISLAPADLPKHGTHYDLAIACGVLAAADELGRGGREAVDGTVLIGELGLDGGLRCVHGVLPMVMAAAAHGFRRVLVPEPQVAEAAMVPGIEVVGARSLRQVVAVLTGREVPEAPPVAAPSGDALLRWRGDDRGETLDMADLVGMRDARYAVEVAAAGCHHLLLSGPKGAGKTTLAERLPGLLPDLDPEESRELTALHSLAGVLDSARGPIVRPPWSAPHHGASAASILGGGSGRVRPGEVSRAHLGVLFMDEFPLFRSDVVDALRQPLESGEVTIARGEETATYPARGLVVLACNPCPCGDWSADAAEDRCTCTEVRRRDYRRRITGPVADRIDVQRHVRPLRPHEADVLEPPESTAVVRARVEAARQRQAARWAGCSWRLNGHAPGPVLRDRWPLPPAAQQRLDEQTWAGRLSRRGVTRVHRVAWTVADLRGADRPTEADVDVALRLRTGEPVPSAALRRQPGGRTA